VLDVEDARRVLTETPEPFATDTVEKHAALAHFEPHHVLISDGVARARRRALNEEALEPSAPVHHAAGRILTKIDATADELVARGGFDWPAFRACWMAMARDVVFGPSAAEDLVLARALDSLREDANWVLLKPVRRVERKRLLARIAAHLALADDGSLAAPLAAARDEYAAPLSQIAHWLFAFDAAGITALRALALLEAHPQARRRAVEEGGEGGRPFLRAVLLETVRLWPTTPLILRETKTPTKWRGSVLPAGTGIMIFLPYFHRDPDRLAFANRLAPEVWLEGRDEALGLLPFSAGPAACPGRNLVLLMAGAMLARLLTAASHVAGSPIRDADALPLSFDHTRLVVDVGRQVLE
jgi:cytochrome P450